MAVADAETQQRFERLSSYLAADPANPSLLESAADAALACGLRAEALTLLEQSLALQPKSPGLQFKKGLVLLASADYTLARSAFQQLVDAGNYHPAITYNLAYAAFGQGRPDEALQLLDSVVEVSRKDLPEYELLYARALYHTQEFDRALQHVDRYLAKHADASDGLGLKAMLLYDTSQNELATRIAQDLLFANADDLQAHVVLGSVALEQRDAAVAREHFQQVVDHDPNAGRAWSGLAFAALLETRLSDAVACFECAVQHMPNHLGTWHGLAWAHIMTRDFTAARSAIDAAMALDRTFSENHGMLAVLLVLEGRIAEAEAEAKRGMRLNPKSAASHFARSLLMAQAGDAGASQRLVDKILAGAGLQSQGGIADAILGLGGAGKRSQAPNPAVQRSSPKQAD
ncbi:MAG: tetratricopeptide repeat protein [Nevskia sp.]|jgi:tetratricopeptide (TPR) repeat protein|nr:tetratricopeptide repeat protein [Nevskia sp.]